jgi:hypothetical protein
MCSFQGPVCYAARLESALAPPSLSLDEPVDCGIPGKYRNSPLPHDHTVTKIRPAILAVHSGQYCVAVAGAALMGLALPAPHGLVQALEKSGDYRVLSPTVSKIL